MPGWSMQGLRLVFVLTISVSFMVIFFISLVFGLSPAVAFRSAWHLAALFWLGVLTWFSVSMAIQAYHRERDQGTLQVVSLTRIPPFREVAGRWAGALIPVFEGWAAGLLLVFTSVFLPPHYLGSFPGAFSTWIITAFWCAALAAVGLACSAGFRSILGSIVGFFVALVLAALLSIVAFVIFSFFVPPGDVFSGGLTLPPSPLVFQVLREGPFSIGGIVVIAAQWSLFIVFFLGIAALLVQIRFPLRTAGTGEAGPRGIIPASSLTMMMLGGAPAGRGGPWDDPSLQQGPPQPLKVPKKSVPSGMLLRLLGNNPFFVAYARGFGRLYRGYVASPGSAVPPAIVVCTLVYYSSLALLGGISTLESMALAGALLIATAISFCEAVVLGSRSLRAERDQATWPLLLATGLRPEKVLGGKLVTIFYALSGEWSWTIPFWICAALCGFRPGVLMLALVQPVLIALGILAGLWIGSQPRYLIINVKKIAKNALILLGLWIAFRWLSPDLQAAISHNLLESARLLNPAAALFSICQFRDEARLLPAILSVLCQMGMVAGMAAIFWVYSERRLIRVMEGE